tara:strand:+ start:68 stop:502 length:435 start_codon:yes stop_codon:yes gene_type:complete
MIIKVSKPFIKLVEDYDEEIAKTEQLLKRLQREHRHQNYYNSLLANTGHSMLEGWEDNYSDLDIPRTWKNSSWHDDANPSFAFKGWQVWIDAKNVEDKEFPDGSRFTIMEFRNYSTSVTCFGSDDFNEVLNFVNSRVAPFIGVK